jgi:hydroxymethylbilane synthase
VTGAPAAVRAASGPEPAALLAEPADPGIRAAVTAERSLLAALEAGCSAPAGAPAGLVADGQTSELRPRGAVGPADGTTRGQMSITGPVPAPDGTAPAPGRAPAVAMPAMDAAGPMGERTP